MITKEKIIENIEKKLRHGQTIADKACTTYNIKGVKVNETRTRYTVKYTIFDTRTLHYNNDEVMTRHLTIN